VPDIPPSFTLMLIITLVPLAGLIAAAIVSRFPDRGADD